MSRACDYCYAQELDTRYGKGNRWGPDGVRMRTAESYWKRALYWNNSAALNGVRRRVFPSMCDPFDNHRTILPEWRVGFWQVIRTTPHLDWLLLTKRSQNIKRYLPLDWEHGYPNVWLGTTCEDQEEADRRIPHLLRVPAALHFLSCEPLLGPIDLSGFYIASGIEWVIAGGESGRRARPSHPQWIRDLHDQCERYKVPFHFKQWGEWAPEPADADQTDTAQKARGAKDVFFFPDLECVERVGKKRAGHMLDGVAYQAFPSPVHA